MERKFWQALGSGSKKRDASFHVTSLSTDTLSRNNASALKHSSSSSSKMLSRRLLSSPKYPLRRQRFTLRPGGVILRPNVFPSIVSALPLRTYATGPPSGGGGYPGGFGGMKLDQEPKKGETLKEFVSRHLIY